MRRTSSYAIRQIGSVSAVEGRKLLGWELSLEGGLMKANNSATQPEAIGGYLPIEKVYSYDPVPTAISSDKAKHVLGAQANLWAEYMPTYQHVEYMAFPRALALSEIVWSKKEDKNWEDFKARLQNHYKILQQLEINYYRPSYNVSWDGYPAQKELTLTNGKKGGLSYGDGEWQGFTKDLDITVDFERREEIKSVAMNFMQVPGPGCCKSKIATSFLEGNRRQEFGYALVIQDFLHTCLVPRLDFVHKKENLIAPLTGGFELGYCSRMQRNVIIICTIENFDPMGIHTGDSITVAPAMTLSDRCYQDMRNQAIKMMRSIGNFAGGCNVQFSVNPENEEIIAIEINPRVSRSSALAS
ncbi:hypothetical protein FQR65_LT18005 [Abscondita terminalis]|nr:hypothetical protein FQR65_LT18005 [Abscondita terminalis]